MTVSLAISQCSSPSLISLLIVKPLCGRYCQHTVESFYSSANLAVFFLVNFIVYTAGNFISCN